jgi:RimJ/RimL family protein N-acetyltransferase
MALHTKRLDLRPFGRQDFDRLVTEMLTDPRVVEFHYSFRVENYSDRMRLYRLQPSDAAVH